MQKPKNNTAYRGFCNNKIDKPNKYLATGGLSLFMENGLSPLINLYPEYANRPSSPIILFDKGNWY